MSSLQRPVLVGVDGSRGALHALGLAATEAAAYRLPLRILHVARADPRRGRAAVADAEARALRRYPQLEIDARVLPGRPGHALTEASAGAAMTVLGCRGLSGLAGTLAGSVSSHVACHGHGPVLVARGDRYAPDTSPDWHPGPTSGPPTRFDRHIVVGVDGLPGNDPALGFAFEEAAVRGVALHATLVWVHPPLADLGEAAPPGRRLADARRAAEVELETALVGWWQKYPEVPVKPVLMHSRHPARKLVDASAGADLVVVGSNRRGRVAGLLGGSVGHALVHHARCPVAVVHGQP